MGVKVTGSKAAGNRLVRYAAEVQRETKSILMQEARALAVEYGSATMPGPGFSDGGNVEAFRNRVEGDARKVFASKQDPGSVFALMKIHAPHLAGPYWRAIKTNKPRAAADIMRRANLPTGIDPAALKKARTGKKGRVPGPRQPVSLSTEAQVRTFARKQRQLVGLAKAGWYAAAKGIGGRVRRSVVGASGGRRSEQVFPSFIRRLARVFPGLGGAWVSGGDQNPRVIIWSSVKHAASALPPRLQAAAADRARSRVAASIRQAMAAINRRGNKAA